MPETVKIAGKKVPKNVVIAGGLITAGIVGYAWFQNARSGAVPGVANPTPNLPVPTDEPGFGISGGDEVPRTNSLWTQHATALMVNVGWEGGAVSSALGKFLSRLPLNKVEADIVRAAVGQAGFPPENGPWVVIEETPGVIVPTLTMPQNLRYLGPAAKDRQRLQWDPVPGAASYMVQYTGPGGIGPEWPEAGTSHTAYLAAGPTYSYNVWAIGNDGKAGPKASINFVGR